MKNCLVYLILILTLTTSATNLSAQNTAEDLFKLGNEHVAAKRYDAAVAAFSDCIRVAPTNSSCYYNRSVANYLIASSKPLTPAEIVAADSISIKNSKRLAALADANKVIELLPKKARGYYMRASLYAAEKIYEKAILDFRQALAVEPTVATTEPSVFEAATKGLATAEKELPFSIVVKGRRTASRAMEAYRAGDIPGSKRLYQEAVDIFTAAIALDANSTDAFDDRANAYRWLENYEASAADYTRSIAISEIKKSSNHNYEGVQLYSLVNRAGAYAKQKKTALALADYARVLATPKGPQSQYPLQNARVARGKLYLDNGKLNEAIADFDIILAETPKYAQVAYYRGLAYAKKGDRVKAIADLTKAVELDPKNADAVAELKKLAPR